MGFEIERKFLVLPEYIDHIREKSVASSRIVQGYLSRKPAIRVRISTLFNQIGKEGSTAQVTIKGPGHIHRAEFNYDVPIEDAHELMKLANHTIIKIRHLISFGLHMWEVDEFLSPHLGLWLAEIELDSEDERFVRPFFVGDEVSENRCYSNSYLAAHPEFSPIISEQIVSVAG
jgi:adenylate cyclase